VNPALPFELLAELEQTRKKMVEQRGIEPLTSTLRKERASYVTH